MASTKYIDFPTVFYIAKPMRYLFRTFEIKYATRKDVNLVHVKLENLLILDLVVNNLIGHQSETEDSQVIAVIISMKSKMFSVRENLLLINL